MQIYTVGLIFWGTIAAAALLSVLSAGHFEIKQRMNAIIGRIALFRLFASSKFNFKVPVSQTARCITIVNAQHRRSE